MKAWLIAAAGIIGLAASSASAAPISWSFSNLVFDDGGTASGQFVWDSDTDTVTSWNINTTEEVGNANFPAFTYSNTIAGHVAEKEFGIQTNLRFLQFAGPEAVQPSGVDRARVFRLGIGFGGFEAFDVLDTASASLALVGDGFKTDVAGGIFPFVPNGFVECLFCSPFRDVAIDSPTELTTSSTVPLPATLPLAIFAFGALGAFGMRRRQ